MTRLQIQQACKGQFALTEAVEDPEFLDAQWNRAINAGYRWLAKFSRLIGAEPWAITTTSAREYTLLGKTPQIATIDFVLFKQGGTNGTWRKLNSLQPQEIATVAANFHETTGSPTHYYVRGSNKLGLYPKPDTTNQGAFMEVWGWAYPASLDEDGTSPTEIDVALHDYLIAPALYEMAKQSRNAGRPDAEGLVARYDAERMRGLAELKAHVEMLDTAPRYVNTSSGSDYEEY